jgi:hypothetical protein
LQQKICITAATYNVLISLEGLDECGWHVIHGEDDLGDTGLGQSLDLVAQDGLVSEEHEGLRHAESQGSQASAIASDENKSLHNVFGL